MFLHQQLKVLIHWTGITKASLHFLSKRCMKNSTCPTLPITWEFSRNVRFKMGRHHNVNEKAKRANSQRIKFRTVHLSYKKTSQLRNWPTGFETDWPASKLPGRFRNCPEVANWALTCIQEQKSKISWHYHWYDWHQFVIQYDNQADFAK